MNCANIWGPQITLEGSRDQNLRGDWPLSAPPVTTISTILTAYQDISW